MDVKLTVTKTLDDNIWGFSDILEGFDDVSPDERRTMIIEYIRDVDPWEAVDPDAGAIWTVAIDGDAFDWQARAEAETARANELEAALLMDYDELSSLIEALYKRVVELEARLAEQEWRPVTDDMESGRYLVFNWDEPQLREVMELVYNDITRQWYSPGGYDDIMPAPTHCRPLPPPPAATE